MTKNVIVISGHSGVGKSTLITHILKNFENVKLSVSCTTRAPRLGEKDRREYYFLTHEKFEEKIKYGAFIEYTECFGNYYGTLKCEINRILGNGDICLLDIEFAGAYNVFKNHVLGPDVKCSGILIEPPSIEELKRRLIGRGESEKSIDIRLDTSQLPKYLQNYRGMYSYVIVNNELSMSKKKIVEIVERLLK